MRLFTLLFILTIFTACGQSTKTNMVEKKITRNIQQDINSLIPSGEIIVDIRDKVKMSPRKEELQAKFAKAMQENSEWFLEQQKLVASTGKSIAYDSKLGMTESEWKEFQELFKNNSDLQYESSGTAKIVVTKNKDIISFKATNQLNVLNSITIDTKSNIVYIDNYKLIPKDTICVPNSDNILNSAWRGYNWGYFSVSSSGVPTTKEELAKYSAAMYNFTLGLIEKTGQTYLVISGDEVKNGIQTIKFKIPLIF